MGNPEQYIWWQRALAGERGELTRGDPKSGFYRDRSRACAIWRDENGALQVSVTSGFCPRNPDEIDDAFGSWAGHPISYEDYKNFLETGRWPDSIDPPAPAIGDNMAGMEPHERVLAEIKDLQERFDAWLKTLPNGIENDTQDAKAANYAKEIAALGTKADDTHKAEKAPHLEAGRKVDAAWKPVVAAAADAKKKILAPTTTYRVKRAAEAERARQAEQERLRAESQRAHEEAVAAAERGEGPAAAPVPSPIQTIPKRATGLRNVKVVQIDDLPTLAAQLAALPNPPEEFVEVCRKLARKMLEAGAETKGARLVNEQRAA